MKTNTFKKFFSVIVSFSLALVFSVHGTYATSSIQGLGTHSLQPGEDKFIGLICVEGKCADVCDIDGTSGTATYSISTGSVDTIFTMYLKEKGKLIAEQQFTGEGSLEFDARKYKSVTFGLRNDMETTASFSGLVSADQVNCNYYSAASRIIAPVTAILGALLFLF